MLTIIGKLITQEESASQVVDMMHRYSSCMHFVFQRLLEGQERNALKREMPSLFKLNTRYCDDAILQAQGLIKNMQEKGVDPKKTVFGGKSLLKQLSKKHLSQKQMDAKKEEWKEKRRMEGKTKMLPLFSWRSIKKG
jgi:predicted transposase